MVQPWRCFLGIRFWAKKSKKEAFSVMEAVHGFKFLWNKILKEYKVYYFLYGFVSIIMKALIVATLLRVGGFSFDGASIVGGATPCL
uniref:Uncharacterized protein n=2 Tax=Coprothermobacter TaxID=68335 RepID=B5Y6D4_COPPD